MKGPLSPRSRLLGCEIVEILLITVASLKERLQVVLLQFLANDLLQRLPLQDLIGFLLRAKFDEKGLVNPLERGHFSMLSGIARMRRCFQLADVGLTLCCVRTNRPNSLQAARIHCV